jgi:hypothetical protein
MWSIIPNDETIGMDTSKSANRGGKEEKAKVAADKKQIKMLGMVFIDLQPEKRHLQFQNP